MKDDDDLEEHFLEECYHKSYSKIKFLKSFDTLRGYLDDYEAGLFRNKILLEIILQLDPFKTTSERLNMNILDFFGDLGGFYQAIDLLVFLFGQFFSAKLFIASISSSFYYRKLSQEESKENLEMIER